VPIQLPAIPNDCTKIQLGIERPFVENAKCWLQWLFYDGDRHLGIATTQEALEDIDLLLQAVSAQGWKQSHHSVMREFLNYTYERSAN
jgi:hypothetical protein